MSRDNSYGVCCREGGSFRYSLLTHPSIAAASSGLFSIITAVTPRLLSSGVIWTPVSRLASVAGFGFTTTAAFLVVFVAGLLDFRASVTPVAYRKGDNSCKLVCKDVATGSPKVTRKSQADRLEAEVSEHLQSTPLRPHLLTVRKSGSHPGNPGSIPGEVTSNKAPPIGWFFCCWWFLEESQAKRHGYNSRQFIARGD